jgi:hypothetical protein
MRVLPVLSLILMAACGADGPPVAPSKAAAGPGVSVSGTVGAGVVLQ